MKANPGGAIDPNEVVGRDDLIRDFWSRLEQQSVLLTAERRVGKTTIIKTMQAKPPKLWRVIFQDLESCASPEEFALSVYQQCRTHFPTQAKIWDHLKQAAQVVEHDKMKVKFGQQKAWKPFLQETIQTVVTGTDPFVFLWDEFTYFLQAIIRKSKGDLALAVEIVDTLRGLRQTHRNLRMVLTGSIGLHHVTTSFTDAKIPSAPFNDLYPLTVPPLDSGPAELLAKQLLEGEGLHVPDMGPTTKTIAREADSLPYYIHHIVAGLKRLKAGICDESTVIKLVESKLREPTDDWNLKHYRDRLKSYYPGPDDVRHVSLILDSLAFGPKSQAEILREVNTQSIPLTKERLVELLSLLARDHYLTKDESGYRFLFSLIGRWWAFDRDLSKGASS